MNSLAHSIRLLRVGVLLALPLPLSAATLPAIEFYNDALKHYFLTIDPNEAAAIDAGAAGAGWRRTGGSFNVWTSPASGSQPVCRFYGSVSPGPNSHFFTGDAAECAGLRAQEASIPETERKWHYEGIAFHSVLPQGGGCAGGTTPVHRYYNNGHARGEDANHRLTSDAALRAGMEAAGWIYEGVAMCAPGASIEGPSYLAPCPADTGVPLFDTSPVAVSDFIAFRPLGFMSVPIHMFPAKHSAFSMTPIGQAAIPKPVRSPGKASVTEIYEARFSTGARNYQVFLHPCREVRAYFGHLATLSDKLLAEFNNAAPVCNSFSDGSATVTTCRRENLNIPLESGEPFGTGPDSAGVDFGTLDFRRTPAAFIDPAAYDHYYPYYLSPLDLFVASERQAIVNKTGSVFGTRMRTAEPVGGSYMQDIAGSAQGNWFLPGKYHGNSTDMSVFLGLAHDYVDPSQPLMAAGSSIKGIVPGLFSYTPAAAGTDNRDFAAIRVDGQIHCIDRFMQGQSAGGMPIGKPAGVLLLSLPDATTLTVELVAGNACATLANRAFTANATRFVRGPTAISPQASGAVDTRDTPLSQGQP